MEEFDFGNFAELPTKNMKNAFCFNAIGWRSCQQICYSMMSFHVE
jgi:hypothetical protein